MRRDIHPQRIIQQHKLNWKLLHQCQVLISMVDLMVEVEVAPLLTVHAMLTSDLIKSFTFYSINLK